jgi:hypothetical protein
MKSTNIKTNKLIISKIYVVLNRMKKNTLLLSFLLLVLFSCRKRERAIEWNVDMLYPLINGNLSIGNILPDSILHTNADSSLSIRFETTLLSLSIDSLAAIPDTTFELAYALPLFIPITVVPGQQIINNPEENKLSIDGAELTEVIVKSGNVNYRIESTIPGDIIYTYTIPSAKDANGIVFSKQIAIPKSNGSVNSIVTGSFSLANYIIDLRGLNGNKTNTLLTTVNAKLSPTNLGNITVSNIDTLLISNTISEVKIEKAEGYFGQHDFQIGPETTYIDYFNRITAGSINIDELNASLTLENGIGVDAFLRINSLFSKRQNESPVVLQHSMIGTNHVMNRGYKMGNSVVPTQLQFNLNSSNSNLKNLLTSFPDSLGYDAFVQINPLGNISSFNDFVYAANPLRLLLNVDMPLNVVANQLTLVDTLLLDINDESALNDLALFIDIENGFPMNASIQLTILDGNNMTVSNILVPGVIPSGSIGSNNRVSDPSKTYHEIKLLPKDLENIQRYKKLKLQVVFNSPQSNHLYIYDYYQLKYFIRAQSNVKISIR